MAFERIGIGAIITFDEKGATGAMGKARASVEKVVGAIKKIPAALTKVGNVSMQVFRTMSTGAARVGSGFGRMQGGIMSAALGMGLLTVGVFAAGKQYADFEQQMSATQSVTDFSKGSIEELTAEAKRLGATSAFTATQASQGMENLGRAGFKASEQIAATGNVLNLAAADSIELSTAADVTAQVLRGMGMAAIESGRVVDVLASASANSNTNVIALGESFKMASSVAVQMNIPIEETAAILGTMSDAGLRGTMAGTAFTNMMNKLSKPTERGAELMKKYGVSVKGFIDPATGLKRIDFPGTITTITAALKKIDDPLKRGAVAMEIFGLRGNKAANAFVVKGSKGLIELTQTMKSAEGTAKRMADMRLDNFHGQITLLKSAVEGFNIELMGGTMVPLKDILKESIIPGVQALTGAFQMLNAAVGPDDIDEAKKKYGATTVAVIIGIKNALTFLKDGFDSIVGSIKRVAGELESRFGPDMISKVVKFATIFAFVAAAVVPVILAIVTVGFVIGGLVAVVTGFATVLSGLFAPVLIIVGALGLAYLALRQDNESLLETATRVWAGIKMWALDAWENAVKPFWEGVKEATNVIWPKLANMITEAFAAIKTAIVDVFNVFGIGTSETETDWKSVGETVVNVIAVIIGTIVTLIKMVFMVGAFILKAARQAFFAITDFIIQPFVDVFNLLADIGGAFGSIFGGNIKKGLMELGNAILKFIAAPIRMVLRQMVRLADALGAADLIPQGLRDFMNQGTITLTGVDKAPRVSGGKPGAPELKRKPEIITEQKSQNITEEARLTADITDAASEKAAKLNTDAMKEMGDKVTAAANKQPCIDNTTSITLDGAEVAKSTSRHESELKDRAGFKATPYQRRMAIEQGAMSPART